MQCDLEVWEFQKHWYMPQHPQNQCFSWFDETPQSVVTHTSRMQIIRTIC
jgi:hypothetical protein